jgi:DinB superfamily
VDRRQLLKRLDKAWVAFNESYAGLSDAQLMEPGVTGAWSVRDILAHVTTWEEEALKHLPLILKGGGRPPRYSVQYGGIDAFNARMTEQKRNLSLSEVCAQFVATHGRLVDFIQSAPSINSSAKPASVIDYGSIRTAITRSTPRRFGNGDSGFQTRPRSVSPPSFEGQSGSTALEEWSASTDRPAGRSRAGGLLRS